MSIGVRLAFALGLASCSSKSAEPPVERVKELLLQGAGGGDERATEALHDLRAASVEAAVALIDDPAVGEAAYRYVVKCAALWDAAITTADDDAKPPAERKRRWTEWLVTTRSSLHKTRGFDCRPGMKEPLLQESTLPSPGAD